MRTGGRKGIQKELALKYNVTRKTIGLVINKRAKELQIVTNEVEQKKAEIKTLEYKVDTYKERANLIKLLKQLEIVPIMKKIQHNANEDQKSRLALQNRKKFKPNYQVITDKESSKLKSSVDAIEKLLRGLDDMHKVDIHFHMDKIINVFQNLDDDTGRLLIPELKKLMCTKCPLFIKHHEEIDKT